MSFSRIMLACCLAASLLTLPLSARAQAQTEPLRFEVLSVKARQYAGDEPSNRRVLPGGQFVATGTTARTLIRIAFGTDDNRMQGVPGWADNELYDINATTADHIEITNPQQFQQLILSILQERFQLRFHREAQQGPVYRLVMEKAGKLGPALTRSDTTGEPSMSNSGGLISTMTVANASMKDIAAVLQRQAGRPVEDATGLKGRYDFRMQWAKEAAPDSSEPNLFIALKEQLGLKLLPAKGPVEMIVVDKIEHPSAN